MIPSFLKLYIVFRQGILISLYSRNASSFISNKLTWHFQCPSLFKFFLYLKYKHEAFGRRIFFNTNVTQTKCFPYLFLIRNSCTIYYKVSRQCNGVSDWVQEDAWRMFEEGHTYNIGRAGSNSSCSIFLGNNFLFHF